MFLLKNCIIHCEEKDNGGQCYPKCFSGTTHIEVDVLLDIISTIPSSSPEQIPRGGNQGSKQPAQQFPDCDLLHIRDIPRPPVPLHAGQEPEEQLRQRIYLP